MNKKKIIVLSTGAFSFSLLLMFGLMLCSCLIFGLVLVILSQDLVAYFFIIMGILALVSWTSVINRTAKHLYSWYTFEEEKVVVKGLFSKTYSLYYDQLSSAVIAHYVHGVLNSSVGSKIHFICLSYDVFDTQYQNRINSWRTNERCLKVEYTKKLGRFLLDVLPPEKAQMLLKGIQNAGLSTGASEEKRK